MEKTTDKNGMIFLNLTFNKENYENKFLLETKIDNKSISKEVGFLSDTPILLSVEHSEERESFKYSGFSILITIIAVIITVSFARIKLK